MITVYICDDNDILLQKYKAQIAAYALENNMQFSLKTFSSGEQLLFRIEEHLNDPDIIYLDIMMGELNGIETAKKLRAYGCQAEIIFLTSSDEYVFESFDVDALHYIMKDDSKNGRFEEILGRAVGLVSKRQKEVFICECGNIVKQVPINSISCFEVRNRIVTAYFEGTSFDFYSTIEKLEQELSSKGFVRCHRSFLISLKYIDEISKDKIKTVDGMNVPIGPNYLKTLKLAFSASLANF